MKQIINVICVLVTFSSCLRANQDNMVETNSLAISNNVRDPNNRGLLVDHDIRLPVGARKEDYYQTNNVDSSSPFPFEKYNAGSRRKDVDDLWMGTMPIPYVIESSIDALISFKIGLAMEDYKKYTCIRFRKKEDSDQNWLRFVGNDDGCWSYVGKYGTGGQIVSLETDKCYRLKTVVHEIMHALGFWHEQSRPDRDNYVKIHYENVKDGVEDNFQKLNPLITESYGVAYDYRSVMHYYATSFSKNGNNTITRVDGELPIFGQPFEGSLSPLDIEQINILYNCTDGWGPWSLADCSVTCGVGIQTFTRKCTVGSSACAGESTRVESCIQTPCPTTSTGQWSDWKTSTCNSTCGEGYQRLTRECIDTKTQASVDSCPGESVKYEKCVLPACPGQWGSWQEGSCSVTCGTGLQIFTRECPTINCVGVPVKFEPCVRSPCSTSTNQWTDWKSSTCNSTCGEGYKKLSRECIDTKTQTAVDSCSGVSVMYEKCVLPSCPSSWGSWQEGSCSVTCGSGMQIFTRKCSTSNCVGNPVKFEPCILPACSISQWSDWKSSPCNSTCGEGYKKLTRECIDIKTQTATDGCVGVNTKYEKCVLAACQGQWGSWQEGSCSVTCGSGMQIFARKCSTSNCVGEAVKVEPCNKSPCSQWTIWKSSSCNSTCGEGYKKLSRECIDTKTQTVVDSCPGKSVKYEKCNLPACPGQWGSWQEGSCSVTCGSGMRIFTRKCSTSNCDGVAVKFETCQVIQCSASTTGQWTNWTSTPCNTTCGEGYKKVTRGCIDPKTRNITDSCVGENVRYEKCDLPVCYGEWSLWQEGICSKSCGTGSLLFTRKCSKTNCTGEATKVESCHQLPCECFPSNAYVRNKDGMKISMKSLKIGDEVLTIGSEGAPTYSEIIMMLHQDAHQTMNGYIQINTRDGIAITMTSNHLIPTSKDNFVFAKDVQQGQNVTVYDPTSNTFKSTEVISTHQVTDVGLYAPLSMEGTLIVNDIHVSCYAVFPSHTISHYAFTLWRFMYTYFESATKYLSVNDEVVHWYPRTLYNMASYVGWL